MTKSLLCFDHNYWSQIKDNPEDFSDIFWKFLRETTPENFQPLEKFGIKIIDLHAGEIGSPSQFLN